MSAPKCWLWLVIMPGNSLVRTGDQSDTVELDPEWSKVLSDELGEVRVLVSATHWSGLRLMTRYRKREELVFADSGGAQFINMPKHRMGEFYKKREVMYRAQIHLGDVIAAGDIPGSKAEMSKEQLDRSLQMTIENTDLQFKIGGSALGWRFLNALHGVNPDHQERWYQSVKHYPSIGWAIGVKPLETIGTLLQLFFLYQKGELKKGTILHIFGTGAASMLYGLWHISEKLGLEVQWSVDCSSHSLMRFGRVVGPANNEGILYSEIRSGEKKLELYDGDMLTDIPGKLSRELSQKIFRTSTMNYCRYWKSFVEEYRQRTPKVEKILVQDKVYELYKWFRLGGIELIWSRVAELVPGREQVSLR